MKKIVLLTSVIVMVMAVSAFAQEKIALIDYPYCMLNSAAGKAATEELKKLDTDKAAELKPLRDELQKMESDFAAKEKLLTEDAKRQEAAKFQTKLAEYERLARTAQNDIQKRSDELTNKAKAQIDIIIADYAKEKKYTLVLQIQSTVFHQNVPNISDDIIARYDKAYQGK